MGTARAWLGHMVVVATLVTGCIQPELVPCGDNLCPIGSLCVGDALCATPEQLEACDGVGEGEPCQLADGTGACTSGICAISGCGNSTVEHGEACDDGNVAGGDGCSPSCDKIEMCGDGVLDELEVCDDGNMNAIDGCDACRLRGWSATALAGGNTLALEVGLDLPRQIVVDRGGNYFIADSGSGRVFRVDAGTGIVTTVAGGGAGGDGVQATSASLGSPRSIAVDDLGNLYISVGTRIRRVDSNGIIRTVAGTNTSGFAGDGGNATAAQLSNATGVAVDGLGNLYIADTGNSRVRHVDTSGRITTIAGGGPTDPGDGGLATSAVVTSPVGVALDATGNLYIAENPGVAFNGKIRRVDAVTGIITTVASGLSFTPNVEVDAAGTLYYGSGAQVMKLSGGQQMRIAGTTFGYSGDGGPATSAQFGSTPATTIDHDGSLLLADAANSRIRSVATSGMITTIVGNGVRGATGDGAAATSARLMHPTSAVLDSAGNAYIVDRNNCRVVRLDATGVLTTIAGIGVAGDGGDGGPATQAQFDFPSGITLDPAGNVYVADENTNRVRRIDTNGIITNFAGTTTNGFSGDSGPAVNAELDRPIGLAYDPATGSLFIADYWNGRVRRVDQNGIITTFAGGGTATGDGGLATDALIDAPTGLAFAGGNLYISDGPGSRIRRVDAAGVITTFAGTGTAGDAGDGGPAVQAELRFPNHLAYHGGMLYIADLGSYKLRRIDQNGVIDTIAGNDNFGDQGDGGLAVDATLNVPDGVAAGPSGVYILDTENNRCRRIDASGIITTVAGAVDPEGMGPLGVATLAEPRGLVVSPDLAMIAGGASGTVQAIRDGWVRVVIGRYEHRDATGNLARYRDRTFGTVGGIAHDVAGNRIFITETDVNQLHVVTMVDPANAGTWTIEPLNLDTSDGALDGTLDVAQFRAPTGLHYDAAQQRLYVADTGNHTIRAIDLAGGIAAAMVTTVAGTPATRGLFGDGGAASTALLHSPEAITSCPNGDLFVADTRNHRIRRIAAGTQTITTVLGDGVAASSGEGSPATTFPVDTPAGLACDATGNVFASSSTAVRLLLADEAGVVDGTGAVQTIYGVAPRDTFPASVTRCLTGIAIVNATTVQTVDACTGVLVEVALDP